MAQQADFAGLARFGFFEQRFHLIILASIYLTIPVQIDSLNGSASECEFSGPKALPVCLFAENPSRLVSLWDMIRADAGRLLYSKGQRNPGGYQARLANQRAGVKLASSGRVRRFNPGNTAAR